MENSCHLGNKTLCSFDFETKITSSNSRILLVLVVFYLFFVTPNLGLTCLAQDLCAAAPTGYTRFTPTVNQTTICSGETVTFDVTGISNFTIYQGYQNQTFSQLSSLPQTNLSSVRLSNPDELDRIVTLLLVGQRGTANIIGCINVTVRPMRTPKVTFESCTNGDVFIFLDDPSNLALGNLTIDWNDGTKSTVDPRIDPLIKKSFPISASIDSRIFSIGPAPGTTCGKSAPIEVNTRGKSNFAILTNLTQDIEDPDIITVDLSNAPRGEFDLFIRNWDEAYQDPFTPFQTIKAGTNVLDLPKNIGSFCIVANRRKYCPSNITNEICQIKLDEVLVVEVMKNQLNWSAPSAESIKGLLPSIGEDTKIGSSLVSVQRYDSRAEIGKTAPKDLSPLATSSPYFDSNSSCLKESCYQLVWRTEGILRSPFPDASSPFTALSYSNILCVDRATLPKPPAPDVRVSVVSNQQVHLYADKPTAPWPFELVSFDIQDKINGINQFPWIDPAAQPAQASFCYQVRVQDECLIYSEWSEPACTIHLQSLPTNELIWSPQSPFQPGEIDQYTVFFAENTKNGIEAQFTPVVNRHFPDLDSFEEFADYRIEAISTTGRASYSNTVRIPLQFKIFIPTAFSPNGDGINDTWGPKGRFINLETYDLRILNRQSQEIWSTQNPKDIWDGTWQGRRVPLGQYKFNLKIKTTLESIEKSGNLQVLY
ncbi:MAG: T9SS type B sorting domain-containing protein [Spirosomataceae bacterium]